LPSERATTVTGVFDRTTLHYLGSDEVALLDVGVVDKQDSGRLKDADHLARIR
jgi:hypothetical protein